MAASADFLTTPEIDMRSGGRVLVNCRHEEVVDAEGFTTIDAVMNHSGCVELRTVDRRTNVKVTLSSPSAPNCFYGKCHRTKVGCAAPEAREEWDNILALRRAGVPTPHPVLLVEEPETGRSLILTEELTGAMPLDDYVAAFREGHYDEAAAAEKLASLARRLGHLVRVFHDAGFNHRDLYLCHVFVWPDAPEVLAMIDLQRVQHRQWFRRRWIVKDLAQVVYSWKRVEGGPFDVVTFFEGYFEGDVEVNKAKRQRLIAAARRKAGRMEKRCS